MSQAESRPNFEENVDAVFEGMMKGVLPQTTNLEEEFADIDAKERTAEKETWVLDYLHNKIPDTAALSKMLESLEKSGVSYPLMDDVTDILDEMFSDDDYEHYTDEFFGFMSRMEKFALIVELLAQSSTRPVELSKDDVLTEIVTEELFTPGEKEILVEAADIFLAAE